VDKALRPALLGALLLALSAAPAAAQGPLVDEVKLGVLAHDVAFFGDHVENGADINYELLFTPPEILHVIGSPRPTLGGDINTAGNTDDTYFGLTWGITLIQNMFGSGGNLFANAGLGGAVQYGYTDSAPPGRKALGSPVLFHLSLELGYQFTPRLSISAFLEHMSNADLAPRNAGITSAGGRIGIKF
jgi:hypothetical protein